MPYAELHCKTNFSFLEGAAHADELVARAQELGYTAILVVSLGMLRPWLTAVCALLVAGLLSGGAQLQIQFGLPAAIAGVLLWAILYGVINAQNLAERFRRA